MDYSKVLYSKTVQDFHSRNIGRNNSTNASASSTSHSIDLAIYRDSKKGRHNSGTSTPTSTIGSFCFHPQDSPRRKISSMKQHQNDSGVEDDDHQASSSSEHSKQDDWFSACGSSSLDDNETYHSAISVQCLHQSDDEEDLIAYENSEECRRYMAKIVDRLYSEE